MNSIEVVQSGGETQAGPEDKFKFGSDSFFRRITFRVILNLLSLLRPSRSADQLVFDLMTQFEGTFRGLYPNATTEEVNEFKSKTWAYFDAAKDLVEVVKPLPPSEADKLIPKGVRGFLVGEKATQVLKKMRGLKEVVK